MLCAGGIRGAIRLDPNVGIRLGKAPKGLFSARLFAQVLDGPLTARLVHHDVVTQVSKRAHETAEEMGVPIIPVGAERVGEVGYTETAGHIRASSGCAIQRRKRLSYATAIRSAVKVRARCSERLCTAASSFGFLHSR